MGCDARRCRLYQEVVEREREELATRLRSGPSDHPSRYLALYENPAAASAYSGAGAVSAVVARSSAAAPAPGGAVPNPEYEDDSFEAEDVPAEARGGGGGDDDGGGVEEEGDCVDEVEGADEGDCAAVRDSDLPSPPSAAPRRPPAVEARESAAGAGEVSVRPPATQALPAPLSSSLFFLPSSFASVAPSHVLQHTDTHTRPPVHSYSHENPHNLNTPMLRLSPSPSPHHPAVLSPLLLPLPSPCRLPQACNLHHALSPSLAVCLHTPYLPAPSSSPLRCRFPRQLPRCSPCTRLASSGGSSGSAPFRWSHPSASFAFPTWIYLPTRNASTQARRS